MNQITDSRVTIISAVLISALSATFYNVMPMFVGSAQEDLGFSTWQVSLFPTLFFLGWVLFAGSGFLWLHRVNLRVASAASLFVALASLFVSAFSRDYLFLLALTFIAGSGFSCIYGVGTHLIAFTRTPTRWYGVKIAVEPLPGMIILMALPASNISASTFTDIIFAMLLISLLLSPALSRIPTGIDSLPSESASEDISRGATADIVLALLSVLLFFAAASGMWAFLERIGAHRSFDQSWIGDLLGFTLITATAGSLFTAWIGDRFGNRLPFFVSVSIFIISIAILSGSPNFAAFAGAALIMTFVVGVGLPLVVAEVAARDADNRYVVMTVPAVGLGAMIGPPLFGFLTEAGGVTVSIFACAGVAVLSATLLRD
jgi:hypothetical protein